MQKRNRLTEREKILMMLDRDDERENERRKMKKKKTPRKIELIDGLYKRYPHEDLYGVMEHY